MKTYRRLTWYPRGGAFVGLISNVGSVETLGVEAEGTLLIGNNFLVNANFAVFDAEMKDTLDPNGAIDPSTGEVYDLEGERPRRRTGMDLQPDG